MQLHGQRKMSQNQLLVLLRVLLRHPEREWVMQEPLYLEVKGLLQKNLLHLRQQESHVRGTLQKSVLFY